jgi:hypothetical protein
VLLVVRRVVADDVHDRRVGATGVVQVGEPVAEPRAEVQQRRRRSPGDPGVAVGGTGDDTLEEGEYGPHLGHVVEGGDEVHLRRAGVGEAHVDAGGDEGADEGLGAVHGVLLTFRRAGRGGCRG